VDIGSAVAGGSASARVLSPWALADVFDVELPGLQAAKAETAQVSASCRRNEAAFGERMSLIMTLKVLAMSFVPKLCPPCNGADMNGGRTI
jgi:hypothetical protein